MARKMKSEVEILYDVWGEKDKLDLHHNLSGITKRRGITKINVLGRV